MRQTAGKQFAQDQIVLDLVGQLNTLEDRVSMLRELLRLRERVDCTSEGFEGAFRRAVTAAMIVVRDDATDILQSLRSVG